MLQKLKSLYIYIYSKAYISANMNSFFSAKKDLLSEKFSLSLCNTEVSLLLIRHGA